MMGIDQIGLLVALISVGLSIYAIREARRATTLSITRPLAIQELYDFTKLVREERHDPASATWIIDFMQRTIPELVKREIVLRASGLGEDFDQLMETRARLQALARDQASGVGVAADEFFRQWKVLLGKVDDRLLGILRNPFGDAA